MDNIEYFLDRINAITLNIKLCVRRLDFVESAKWNEQLVKTVNSLGLEIKDLKSK